MTLRFEHIFELSSSQPQISPEIQSSIRKTRGECIIINRFEFVESFLFGKR